MTRKILFFYQNLEIGGTDTFLLGLIKNWCGKEDLLSVWVNKGHKGKELYKIENVGYGEIGFPTIEELYALISGKNLPKWLSRLLKIPVFIFTPLIFTASVVMFILRLRTEMPDVLFSSNGGYPAGELCLSLVIAAKIAGVKKIYLIIHNDSIPKRFPFRLWESMVDFAVKSYCSEIITVSASCAGQLESSRLEGAKIKIIYNGMDLERRDRYTLDEKFRNLGLDRSTRIIGTIGDYEERKGHEYLIRAMVKIKKAVPGTKLVMIGSSVFNHAKYLKKLVENLGLVQDVIMTGYLPEAWEYAQCFDVFVFPSINYESFGFVALEAMFYKKPVIGTSVGGIPEVLGDSGIIVSPKDPDAIAKKTIYLLNNPGEAERLGQKGYERLMNKFGVKQMAKQYFDLTMQ